MPSRFISNTTFCTREGEGEGREGTTEEEEDEEEEEEEEEDTGGGS